VPESIPMSAEEIARLEAEFERLKTEGRRNAREESYPSMWCVRGPGCAPPRR